MTGHPAWYFLLLVLWTKSASSEETNADAITYTVGVIANGTGLVKSVSVVKFGYNITSVWSLVDTSEPFRVFTAAQRFEKMDAIETILLFDWDARLCKDVGSLIDGRKQLIAFDKLDVNKNNKEQDGFGSNSDLCEKKVSTLSHDERYPYCETDMNGESESITSNAMASSIGTRALSQLIVDSLHWSQVYILHENVTEAETADLVGALSLEGVMTGSSNMDTTADFETTLEKVYRSAVCGNPEMNFVVICRSRCVRNILNIASRFDSQHTTHTTMLSQFSRWLVAEYGFTGDLSRGACLYGDDLDNVVIIAIPDVIAPSSGDVPAILGAVVTDLYSQSLDNLTLAENVTQSILADSIKTKATRWHPSARCHGYKIATLLRTTSGREFSTVGTVDAGGHVYLQAEVFPNTKFGYNQRNFIVATLPWKPFVLKRTEIERDEITGEPTGNTTVRYEGFVMELLHELARVLNFTYTLIEPADKKWGGLDIAENLTFNGLIGQVQRLECDFVAAPTSIQPSRAKVVDFSDPYYYSYTTVIVKKVDPSTEKWRTLVDPLRLEVLLTIGLLLGIVTLLLYLMEKYNPNAERDTRGVLHFFHNSLWYMYGCMLMEGGGHRPGSIAGRTLVSCWWLTCIVVVGTYSGNLVAFLTVTKETLPFRTLDEMVANKDYKYGTIGGTSWEVLLMNSSLSRFKKIGDGMRGFLQTDPGVLHKSLKYHLNRVKDGGYAWIGDKTAIEIAMATECELTDLKEEFMPLKYALVFPKNSPHRAIISEQILALRERGLLQIWKKKWWPKSDLCAPSKTYKATPIHLIDIQSAFYVCAAGACVGTIAFVVERIVYKVRQA